MKYIQIYENFSPESPLNETKMVDLPGGFVNAHTTSGEENSSYEVKPNTTYFKTYAGTDGQENTLVINYAPKGENRSLDFNSVLYRPEDQKISYSITRYKDLQAGSNPVNQTVLAKNPAEATTKAYEILGWISHLFTATPGDAKSIGNLVRSFFEIKKLYPEYMAKNPLFKGFLQGILDNHLKPNFGPFSAQGHSFDYSRWNADTPEGLFEYKKEISKALQDVGAIRLSNPPAGS